MFHAILRAGLSAFAMTALLNLTAPVATAASHAASAHSMQSPMVETVLGDLKITATAARETAPGQKVGGGYLAITNTGTLPDRLIGGSAGFAGMVQIHEMKVENDVMTMREIEGGLEIAPGATVMLRPGGHHLMFMALKEPLKAGETRLVELQFEKAGTVTVPFRVLSIADTMKLKDGVMHGEGHTPPKQ